MKIVIGYIRLAIASALIMYAVFPNVNTNSISFFILMSFIVLCLYPLYVRWTDIYTQEQINKHEAEKAELYKAFLEKAACKQCFHYQNDFTCYIDCVSKEDYDILKKHGES